MANLVVDASVAAAWCFSDENSIYSNAVLKSLAGITPFAPRLWAYEIRNSVLMGLRRTRISQQHADLFISSLQKLNFQLVDPVSYDIIFNLAQAYGLTMYDAAYLDLALREGAQLASLDAALRKAAVKAGVLIFDPAAWDLP